jgi:hypothetical protein
LLRTNKRVSNKIAPIGQPKILSNKNLKTGKPNLPHKKTKIENPCNLILELECLPFQHFF